MVGIGASAGGFDAVTALLRGVSSRADIAWVVIVHLSPEHESHLDELLAARVAMPVVQVRETVPLEPGHVYVIPPNANLSAVDSHLRLAPLEPRRHDRAPIDHFFRTLAATHDGDSVAVLLTGGGADGSAGLRRVQETGGLTVAQAPAEAAHPSMPRSAIEAGVVDCVLPVGDMPARIERFLTTVPRLPPPNAEALDSNASKLLDELVGEARARTGHDFQVYRRSELLQRVARRMKLHGTEQPAAYLELLRSDAHEAAALRSDLLLGVTEFFTPEALFTRLERKVIPAAFERVRGSTSGVRVWSVGCSTGEEAYSVAMLLVEEAERRRSAAQLRVFASGLSEHVLHRVRAGQFPGDIHGEITPERLARFFVRSGTGFRVRRELRELVVFAEHDLLVDPPFARIDLILCRTVLRKLEPAARRHALETLAYSLKRQGTLVLGPKDPLEAADLFVADGGDGGRFFRRATGPAPQRAAAAALSPETRALLGTESGIRWPYRSAASHAAIHERAVYRLAPASVLLDERHSVVHYSSGAGAYVRLPGGEPTRRILDLVIEPLRGALAGGLARDGDPSSWRSHPIKVLTAGEERQVTLRLEPVPEAELGIPRWSVLLFDETVAHGAAESAPSASGVQVEVDRDRRIADLTAELAATRRHLDAFTHVSEEDRSELSLSNEELRSTNEEMHAVLEELQVSKEELQAVNVELGALGDESRRRAEELAMLSRDLQHLLESTGIATLFLDRNLRIVRFTPPLAEVFNIRDSDRGRPFSDLNHGLRDETLAADARSVLERHTVMEREVQSERGRWYMLRLLPYRTAAPDVAGVVMSLIDITDRKQAEDRLREQDRLKDEFLATLAHELRNPLAPIVSGIEVLAAAPGDPRVVERITTTMERQARQLVRLIDDLLEVSRITGGRLRLHKAPVELADVVRDSVSTIKPLLERAGHELAVSLPQEQIVLHADAARLTQVLANLLNNAIKYTPRQGHIRIDAKRLDHEVSVTVADDGNGIPAAMQERIFDMFVQVGEGAQPTQGGLGIGLTLARSLVEMHGGTLAARSDGPGHGSEFVIRLPIEQTAAPEPPAAGTADAGRFRLDRQRVLIVDDNVDAAEMLSLLIRTLGGREVAVASSGAAALEAGQRQQPDIVLLDLKMPDMDGYELARRMRGAAWGKRLWLVAVTGWGHDDHRRRAAAAGFDRHLVKPADLEALKEALTVPPDRAHEPGAE